MEKSFASFTIFTFLLLAVSTARISLDPPATTLPVVHTTHVESNTMKSLPGPEDSNIILPSETPKSTSDESIHTPETKTFKVDSSPRSDFARFHAINRHFFDQPRIPVRSVHRRPNRHFVNPFVVPRSEISHGNEVLTENFHRQAQLKRVKANKRDYGHRRHRHQQHRHFRRENNDVSMEKHMFSREKLRSLERQHMGKKNEREHEASFMKGIRKFLKHTFD